MELVKFTVRFTERVVENYFYVLYDDAVSKCKVTPLQAQCGPEGGYSYNPTLP